jgi:hypothetical protein
MPSGWRDAEWQLGEAEQRQCQGDGTGGEEAAGQRLPWGDGRAGAAALAEVAADNQAAGFGCSVGGCGPAQLSLSPTVPVERVWDYGTRQTVALPPPGRLLLAQTKARPNPEQSLVV